MTAVAYVYACERVRASGHQHHVGIKLTICQHQLMATKKEAERLREESKVHKLVSEMEGKELKSSLEQERAKTQEAIGIHNNLTNEIESLTSQLTRSRAEADTIKADCASSRAEVESLSADLMHAKSTVESTAHELARQRANAEGLRTELAGARMQLDSMRDEVAVAKAEAQVASAWAESKTKHAEQVDMALVSLRARLEGMNDVSARSRAEPRGVEEASHHAAGSSESKQREIDTLAAQLTDMRERKAEQDQECIRLRSQLVSMQARVKHLENRAVECSKDMKVVSDMKVALMLIAADMRDLSHQAHKERKQTELRVSEAERSEAFWQQEAETCKKALHLTRHGRGEESFSEMKASLDHARLELSRARSDLTKQQEKTERELAVKDRAISEIKARVETAEREKASEQAKREAVQVELGKVTAEAEAQQGDIVVQKHEGAMLLVMHLSDGLIGWLCCLDVSFQGHLLNTRTC